MIRSTRAMGNAPPLRSAIRVNAGGLTFIVQAAGPLPSPPIPWQAAQYALYNFAPSSELISRRELESGPAAHSRSAPAKRLAKSLPRIPHLLRELASR